MKIFQAYKQEALEIVQNNPYQLVEDIQGIGFSRADELGKRLGMATNHPDRLRAGILYVIEQECNQMGHVYVTADQLYGKTAELLRKSRHENLSEMDLTREVDALKADKKLIIQDEKIYFPPFSMLKKGWLKLFKKLWLKRSTKSSFQNQNSYWHWVN